MKGTPTHLAFAFALFLLPGIAQAQLYGVDRIGQVFEVNTTDGSGTNLYTVAPCGGDGSGATEIEYNHLTGEAFAQAPDGAFCGMTFDITDGAVDMDNIGNAGSHTGIEVANGLWYATVIFAGGGAAPSELHTFNPVDGAGTLVGLTGVGAISGIAFNPLNGTMYGIAGGPGPADFYRINLSDGTASVIGTTSMQAGSLSFGPDGRLYAGGTGPDAGDIFIIDPNLGTSTLLGSTGSSNGITGLTMLNPPRLPPVFLPVPVNQPLALLLLILMMIAGLWVMYRRQKA